MAVGPLYYYVGAGLSTGAGLVGWDEMASIIERYLREYEGSMEASIAPDKDRNEYLLDRFVKERNNCYHRIVSRQSGETLPHDQRALGRAALLNMLLRYRRPSRNRPGQEPDTRDLRVQKLLWKSGCHGIFTSNYDLLLEHAFSRFGQGSALRSYRYTADLLRYILSNRHFVLHLHGDINDIATMEFHPSHAWDRGNLSGENGRGDDLKRVYRAAIHRGHMIYLGCGFRDATIEKLHIASVRIEDDSRFKRVALIYEKDALIYEKEHAGLGLDSKFRGIEFLTWKFRSEVRDFVSKVAKLRERTSWNEQPSPEASQLHHQLFSPSQEPLNQNVCTIPWT